MKGRQAESLPDRAQTRRQGWPALLRESATSFLVHRSGDGRGKLETRQRQDQIELFWTDSNFSACFCGFVEPMRSLSKKMTWPYLHFDKSFSVCQGFSNLIIASESLSSLLKWHYTKIFNSVGQGWLWKPQRGQWAIIWEVQFYTMEQQTLLVTLATAQMSSKRRVTFILSNPPTTITVPPVCWMTLHRLIRWSWNIHSFEFIRTIKKIPIS